jgi:hypothetical protein
MSNRNEARTIVGLGLLAIIATVLINGLLLAGGVWLVVKILRAMGVL